MVMSCAACRKRVMPWILASCGRSRALIWSALASADRLQGDEDAALVEGRGRAAGADVAAHRGDRRILQEDVDQGLLALRHGRERDVLRGLGDAHQLSGILLREEA